MRYVSITKTHLALLSAVAVGQTPDELAESLGWSEATVTEQLVEVCGRLGADDLAEAVYAVMALGLIDSDDSGAGLRSRAAAL